MVFNLLMANIVSSFWLALANAFVAGVIISTMIDIIMNAGLNRAKDELIELLEKNQETAHRLITDLIEAKSVEVIEHDKPRLHS